MFLTAARRVGGARMTHIAPVRALAKKGSIMTLCQIQNQHCRTSSAISSILIRPISTVSSRSDIDVPGSLASAAQAAMILNGQVESFLFWNIFEPKKTKLAKIFLEKSENI